MTAPAIQARTEGLTDAEAARRLADAGPNVVAERRRLSAGSSILAQLRDPLICVLLAAATLTAATGDLTDAAVIGLVVFVNTTVGVAQELGADRAVAALSVLTAPKARVRREGAEREVAAPDIVPGDVLVLSEGDIVPADATLLEAHALLVDEAALTGESVPVGKVADVEEHAKLSAGTVVAKGRAVALVTATGASSSLGRIAALLDTGVQTTPLQRRLAQLGRTLAAVTIALCAVVLALGLLHGEPAERMVVTAISLAVAAVPESLPAVITLSLALGARQMARRHAIVRRLPAVETLGSVTVLATDKTGTLTTGHMRAERVVTPTASYNVEDLRPNDAGPDLLELLTVASLCNDATWAAPNPEGNSSAVGDPTEIALLLAAAQAGLDRRLLQATYPRVAELPFDSTRGLMTTLHRDGNGYLVCTKGAPEVVGPLRDLAGDDDSFAAVVRAMAAELAAEGFRVLALATAHLDVLPARLEDAEQELHLLGLVAVADPPKAAAAATIDACREAGITPLLITGDHAATALTIARRVGVVPDSVTGDKRVVTGAELRLHGVDTGSARIFARIAPEQKLDIVQAWQRSGAIVAMVGDGVNDGPALRRADIGVAMGRHGTEVARQAADLVLADDDLNTVVAAVEEGRRIYSNVRRFLTFALAGGTSEILVMLAGPFVGLPLPLLAAQILWINLLTHGLTGVALGAEPPEPGLMKRGPRPPSQSVLGDGLWSRVMRMALVLTATTLTLALWAHATDRPWQSMTFVTLTSLQLGVALGLRARPGIGANPFLLLAVATSFGLVLAGIYLPALRELLETTTLHWTDVALALAVGAVGWVAIRADLRFSTCRSAAAAHGLADR